MSFEQLIAENTAALNANTAALQVLEAGRQASLDQLKKSAEGGETVTRTRSRKKADEPAVTATETVTEGAVTAPTTAAPAADGLSAIESELKAAVTAHIEGAGEDEAAKKARVGDITAIMQYFGGKLVGPQSTLDDEQKGHALFYVRRYAAGLTVDFGQDYDFAGDPTQGGGVTGAEEFDIG